ncbi:unnamed protein product, partial [Brenthis ino]
MSARARDGLTAAAHATPHPYLLPHPALSLVSGRFVSPLKHNKFQDIYKMMACSYLSTAGVKPERPMAGCWTPPYSLPAPEPSQMTSFVRPSIAPVEVPSVPEPALDLTTTLKPRAHSSSDDDSE